jgi:tetratricopeptide (TPR) repeat protein
MPDPTNAAGWRDLGTARLAQSDFTAALAALDRAIGLDPEYAAAYTVRADACTATGDLARALADLRRATALFEQQGDQQRYREARERIESLVERRYYPAPSRRSPALEQLTRLIDVERYDEAREALTSVADAHEAPALALRLISPEPNSDRRDLALVLCERALALDPLCAAAWRQKGKFLAAADQLPASLEAFERATQLDPAYVSALLGQVSVLTRMKRYRDAWRIAEEATAVDPSLATAQAYRALALFYLHRYLDALPAADSAVQLPPQAVLSQRVRVHILRALGRYEEALGALGKMPHHEDTAAPGDQELRAEILAERSQREEGRALLRRRMIEHREDGPYWAAVVAQLRAMDHADEANTLDAGLTPASMHAAAEAFVEEANEADEMDDTEEALALYERALEIDADNPHVIYYRACALSRFGRSVEALDMLVLLDPEFEGSDSVVWSYKCKIYRANGRMDEALTCIDRAIAANPTFEVWWSEKAEMLRDLGHEAEARTAEAEAHIAAGLLEANPEQDSEEGNIPEERLRAALTDFDAAPECDSGSRRALLLKCLTLARLDRGDEALALLDAALRHDQRDAVLWAGRGLIVAWAGHAAAAVTAFDRALALTPDDAAIWIEKAAALGRLGRHEEELDALDRALALTPENAAVLGMKGAALSSLGRHDEALAAFDRALALDSDQLDLSRGKAQVLRALGREQEAYDAEAPVRQDEARRHDREGHTLYRSERYDNALAAFDHALALVPNLDDALTGRGAALAMLGRLDEAQAAFAAALEHNPNNPGVLFNQINALTSLGRYDEALAILDIGLAAAERPLLTDVSGARESRQAHFYGLKGKILNETGRQDEALAALERSVELDPKLPPAWRELGLVLLRLERYEASAKAFGRALALDDSAAYDWHGRSYALYKLGHYDEALADIDRALELDDSAAIVGTKGEIYNGMGRYTEALDWIDRALGDDPNVREHWENRAIALRGLGRKSEAVEAEARARGE